MIYSRRWNHDKNLNTAVVYDVAYQMHLKKHLE